MGETTRGKSQNKGGEEKAGEGERGNENEKEKEFDNDERKKGEGSRSRFTFQRDWWNQRELERKETKFGGVAKN